MSKEEVAEAPTNLAIHIGLVFHLLVVIIVFHLLVVVWTNLMTAVAAVVAAEVAVLVVVTVVWMNPMLSRLSI